MLEGFICPDGQTIKVEDCLDTCRLGLRCQEKPDLYLMSQEREWTGTPSTTQLINGTMLEFLKLTQPYYVDPDRRVFMLQGTKNHELLDQAAKELGLASEIALSIDRNILDYITWEGDKVSLIDRKWWGSYKVAKALGIVQVGRQPDPSGAVYKTSGRWGKAGSPKMIAVFAAVPEKANNWEAELQLNNYRILLFKAISLKIDEQYLRVVVRDGGLVSAKNKGVYRNSYRIDVPFLPDNKVEDYFEFKKASLLSALANGEWQLPCTAEETWEGLRCEEWCEVWEHCPKGRLVHEIGG